MQFRVILFLCGFFLFSSCRKEELPVSKKERGDLVSKRIDLGEKYVNQVWFNLSTAEIISVNNKFEWDIAFSNDINNLIIKLNTSKLTQAAFVENGEINQNYSLPTSAFKIDHPSGISDSLAMYNWQNQNGIYVIDLGFDVLGNALGFYNLQIISFTNNKYLIKYRNHTENNSIEKEITLNSDYNFQYFSFSKNDVLIVEPKKTEYDIVFTQFTNIFYNPYQPYLVSGVLINPYLVKNYEENNIDFENFGFENIDYFKFSHQSDLIGFDWKYYNFDKNAYEIVKNKVYIIQNKDGNVFKLHFLDFYDENGKVGFPLFQYDQIL
jgi:hypothetical protein